MKAFQINEIRIFLYKFATVFCRNRISLTVLNQRVRKLCVTKGLARSRAQSQVSLSSHSLLKYKCLKELVLKVDSCDIRVPTFVCLSSLTVLKLSSVTFTCDYSNDSEKLTIDFPVLRNYETKNCTWSGVKEVTFKVPLLEVVSIDYRPRSLSDDDSYTEIKFCATRLTEFTYIGYISPEVIVFDLSAAQIASANITPLKYKEESVQELGILKQFNNVECLKFQRSAVLAQAKDSLVDIPAFNMLSHLELGTVTCDILLALLLKTPFLKTLVLQELLEFDEELLNSAIVPDCFLSTLQAFNFGRLDGFGYQLSFANFVMGNALVLKRMSFSTTRMLRNSPANLEEVKEKFRTVPLINGPTGNTQDNHIMIIRPKSHSSGHTMIIRPNTIKWPHCLSDHVTLKWLHYSSSQDTFKLYIDHPTKICSKWPYGDHPAKIHSRRPYDDHPTTLHSRRPFCDHQTKVYSRRLAKRQAPADQTRYQSA
ncbi:FBD domain [Sesbania bispinosa]|nr:FBD domain [Sesbania bispinosa]